MRHLLTLALAVLASAPAFAAPIAVLSDKTDDIAYSSNSHGPTSYFGNSSRGDFIGSGFNTTSISVGTASGAAGSTVFDLKLYTQFDGDSRLNGISTRYADVFLRSHSTGLPLGAFDYALVLGDQTGNGGLATAALYANPTYKTSQQVWNGRTGYTYGGEFVQSGADASTAASIATVATAGTIVQGSGATVTQTGNEHSGYVVDVNFTLTNDQAAALANGFDLLWGTGDCGNDAIFGTVPGTATAVPEPGTLAVLGSGALGLLVLQRRQRARRYA